MNKRQAEFVAKVTREFPDMSPEQVVNACSDLIADATEYYRLTQKYHARPLEEWEEDWIERGHIKDFGRTLMYYFGEAYHANKCGVECSTFYCILVVPSGKSDFMGSAGFCIPPNQEEDEE